MLSYMRVVTRGIQDPHKAGPYFSFIMRVLHLTIVTAFILELEAEVTRLSGRFLVARLCY